LDRRFVWDGHTVLHELPADGDPITWYWEPGTFTPVAREQAGRLLSVASDHLGTPTEMYDESGAPTWQMHLDVLGSPTFDLGAPDDCPFRWPGQYEDEETGLYYNRNRYYEPTFGGYTSLDPIGLDGGMSLLAYVPDPILWTDPLGLARCGGTDAASDTGTEVVQRAMSRAEAEATKATGLVRGGRPGTHYVSDAVNSRAGRAQQRLALPQRPEVRMTMEVPAGQFSPPSRVRPQYGMPGGGTERTATGEIPARVLNMEDM
jgi:RHS repeat-associated protein